MSAGAAGEPHGKVLAYCAERPPGKGRNVHAIVHMPYASNSGIGKKRRQAGLRAARPRAGITLCSQADRSGPGMELRMPPSLSRPVTSCCSTRTRQPGMPVSAGGDVRGGGLMMTGLSGSAVAGMSATGAAAPVAGAPVRLLAMSGRKNASI